MMPLHDMRQYQHVPTPELSMRQRVADYAELNKMTPAGLEPAIFGSEDQRLIH